MSKVHRSCKKAIPFTFLSLLLCFQLLFPAFSTSNVANASTAGESNMSDTAFFGVWDPAHGGWSTPGKLNYAGFPDLGSVETDVKAGNYEQAEADLLNYYKNRTSRTIQGYEGGNVDTNLLPILMDQIITPLKETYLTTFRVEHEPATYSFDMQSKVTSALDSAKMLSLMMMGRNKDTNLANIYSREQNCALTPLTSCLPLLTVQYTNDAGAQTANLIPTMDTYIRGNNTATHASEPLLQVLESGAPYDSNTRQGYLKFDLGSISGTVTGATLKLSGYSELSGHTDVMLYQTGDSAWDENTLTYANHNGKTFSWQGLPGGTDWVGPGTSIADEQYAMQITNFNWLNPLITAYALTGTESYAAKYINYMLDFIHDADASSVAEGAGRFPLTFQASIRANNWVKAYHVLKNSNTMTASANSDILKSFWKKGAHFATPAGFDPRNNHGAFENQAFYAVATYFPEFTDAQNWLSISNSRFDSLISSLNYSDGSYSESSAAYTTASAGAFLDSKELGNLNGQSFNAAFDFYLHGMGKYLADMAFPNGILPLFGDGSSIDIKALVKKIGDLYGDDGLKYVGTAGTQGNLPSYTSVLYPVSKTAIMRSGWTPNDRYLFLNTKQEPSHRHPDDNEVVYYAFGRPLLVDPGALSYSDEPISNWLRFSTEAHNTIEINDTAQNTAEGGLQSWVDNGKFNFAQGVTRNVPGFTYLRDVLFLKSSFSIVSDYVHAPAGTNKYQQTWHFLPTANPVIDATNKKVSTVFNDTYGDIQVVPADPEQFTATLDRGYYSNAFYSVSNATYASYTKNVAGDVTFDTVLYPTASGDNRDISVSRLATSPSVPTTEASALKIDNIGEAGTSGYYYVSHEEVPRFTRSFDTFTFDGKLAYIERSNNGKLHSAIMKSGSTLKNSGSDLIASKMVVNDIAVDWNGTTVEINGSDLVAANDPNAVSAIAIKAPGATSVKLNGTPISNFTVSGDYIYAVGVPSSHSTSEMTSIDLGSDHTGVQTIEFDLIPAADKSGSIIGYTGQSSTVSGETNLPILLSLDTDGTFKAWNGTGFSQSSTLAYKAGEPYHVTILADLSSKTYNVYMTPKDKPEVQIADHFSFNTGAPAITNIGKLVMTSPANDQYRMYHHVIRNADYYTINVSADTHVHQGLPTNNYGKAKTMEIRSSTSPTSVRKGYLRFNLADLPSHVKPEFSKLILTSSTTGTSTDQLLMVSNDSWSESTLTAGNAPTDGAVVATWSTPPAEQKVEVDVQSRVLSELAGDKQLSLLLSSQTNSGTSHNYYTKENANGSQGSKILVYTKDLSPVTGIEVNRTNLTIDEGQTAELEAYIQPTAASNPKVTWTTSDPTVATLEQVGDKAIITGVKVGSATITATAADGNFTSQTTVNVLLPTAPADATFAANLNAPTNTDVIVSIHYPTDAIQKEYKIGDDGAWTAYTTPVALSANGTVFARGTGINGLVSNETNYAVSNIDKIAPVTRAVVNSDASNGSNGWYTSDVTVSLSGADLESAVAKTEYQVNNGDWMPYTGSIPAFGDGIYTVGFRSTDQAGNVEQVRTIDFKIDKTAPLLTVQLDQTVIGPPNHKMVAIHVTPHASDAGSGVASVILTSISSNELDSGQGDIQADLGTEATTFNLRAERSGSGSGRIYTIMYTITDNAGSSSTAVSTVSVPHND